MNLVIFYILGNYFYIHQIVCLMSVCIHKLSLIYHNHYLLANRFILVIILGSQMEEEDGEEVVLQMIL